MNNKGIGLVICLISIAIGCTPLQQHKSASRSRIETGNNISIGFSNFIITQENSVENQNQTSIQEKTAEFPVNQVFDVEVKCGGNVGKWVFLMKDNGFTNTPIFHVLGKTGPQRSMDLVGKMSTGFGILGAGALIRPSENNFTGGFSNSNSGSVSSSSSGP